MRTSRVVSYGTGWVLLTVLAACAVWWGLRPMLGPGARAALPPVSQPGPAASSTPVAISPTPAPTRSAPVTGRTPAPRSSVYEGWQFINGVFLRSFEVTGGSATVRIVNGRVELISATPRDGYTITPKQPEPQRLVLEFFKPGGHFTVVDAMWWENRPYAEVTQVS